MPPFKDLTGQQFGTLKVLGLADHKYTCPGSGQAAILWRVRCERCGREKELGTYALKKAKSCGCLNEAEPQYRKCAVCGKPFRVYPSTKKLCCSLECGMKLRSQNGNSGGKKWSLDAKQRARKDEKRIAKLASIQQEGMKAALSIPEGQRGPQNREAKIWILIDPDGKYYKVINLLDWARKNKDLFFGPSVPEDVAAIRISSGFKSIACSMRGVMSRKGKPATTYKGWRLARLPEEKDKKRY